MITFPILQSIYAGKFPQILKPSGRLHNWQVLQDWSCGRLTHRALTVTAGIEAGAADLGQVFSKCSSATFGLASPPVSNESTAFSESSRDGRARLLAIKTGSGTYGGGPADKTAVTREDFSSPLGAFLTQIPKPD